MKCSLSLVCIWLLIGCTGSRSLVPSNMDEGYVSTPSGLHYRIVKQGQGSKAKQGQEVLIRETTSYLNGTELYSNEYRGSAVKVLIGGNQATSAVDEGLRGMKTGEIRQLIAPPYLVKRKSYPSNVSPDSSLTIKIILIKIL
jgi:FKBP-type peptidyl-prolyl cis-trans isomerase